MSEGLCFRCEHRATALETGTGHRCECSNSTQQVYSCYMYTPTMPVALEKNKEDKRPLFAGTMISARSHSIGIPNKFTLGLTKYKKGYVLYWKPESK